MTGGRLKRPRAMRSRDGTFMLTYGDGVVRRRPRRAAPRSTARTGGWRRSRRCVRRRGSAASSSRATAWSASPRSRRSARAGSTAGSSSSSPAVLDYIDGRRHALGARAARAAGARGPAGGLPARRLLAVHGHAAGQAAARGLWASGKAPWKVWDHERAFWRDRPTLVTGAHRPPRRLARPPPGRARGRRRSAWSATGCPSPSWCGAGCSSGSRSCGATCATRRSWSACSASTRSTPSSTSPRRPIVAIANRNRSSTFETNIAGTWALLEACRRSPLVRAGRPRLVRQGLRRRSDSSALRRRTTPLPGAHPYDVSKSCADLDRPGLRRDLRPARGVSRAAATSTAAAT